MNLAMLNLVALMHSPQKDVAVSQHCVCKVHTCSYLPAFMRPYGSGGSTARVQTKISGALYSVACADSMYGHNFCMPL